MKDMNVVKFCGGLFALIGGFFTIIGIPLVIVMIRAMGIGEGLFWLLFPGLGILFVAIGLPMYIGQVKAEKLDRQALRSGERYDAKIYAYRNNVHETINDEPVKELVLRYFDQRGNRQQIVLSTNNIDLGPYPIGYTVTFRVMNGRYVLDKTSVRPNPIPNELELMSDKPIEAQRIHLVSVKCPSCGASFQAAQGYANRCPYCSNSIGG